MMWLRLAPLLMFGCSTTAPKDGGSRGSTGPVSADSAADPADSGADSGDAPQSPCTGRGTTVSALTESGCVTEAACTWNGDLSYLFTGYTVAGGQDFDGDGVEDFAVSAPFADTVVDAATVYDVGQVDLIWSQPGCWRDGHPGIGDRTHRRRADRHRSAIHRRYRR